MKISPVTLLVVVFSLSALVAERSTGSPASKTAGDAFDFVVCPASPENLRNTEADILPLKDGRLLLAWSDFYTSNSSDWAPSRVSALISKDGGRSWLGKYTLQENIAKVNVMSPELLRLKSGKILFLFWADHSPADGQVMWRISSDDAKTWTDPKALPLNPSPAYWMNQHDAAIQLKSGRILEPLYYTDDFRTNKIVRVRAYYSDDEAKTWKASRTLVTVGDGKITAEEPTIVELKDGSVLMLIRNGTQHIYKSYSRDQGETWSTPEPTELAAAPRSPVKVGRIPSTGDLLVVWNNSPKLRCPLTAAISQDEGKTWKHVKNLEQDERYNYGYTSMTFIDQKVLLTYWVGMKNEIPGGGESKSTYSLKLRSLPAKWFYE